MTPLPLRPQDCPKFQTCNAAVCPLDPAWPRTYMRWKEPVCPYALASGKAGAAERFAGDPVFAAVLEVLPEIRKKFLPIDRAVEKAAKSGFREDNLARKAAPEASGGVPYGLESEKTADGPP
jgi:hypothetical protein